MTNRRRYFLDFYDELTNINIEFDGEYWHKDRKDDDNVRDEYLKSQGITTIRVSDNNYDPKKTVISLVQLIKDKENEINRIS